MPNVNRPLRSRCYTRAMKIEKYGTADDIQELLSLRDGVSALVESHAANSTLLPRADLLDLGDSFQLHLEVPGVQLTDLEIAVQEDELMVAGLREPELTTGNAVFSERQVGPFQRTINLPELVDGERGTAHLASGVLVVTLPKR